MTSAIIKATTFITSEQTEFVDGFLFENAPSNWVLEINHITGEGQLNGFFSSEREMNLAVSIMSEQIGQLIDLSFSTRFIKDQDWKESYKKHFSPWEYKGVHFVPFWLKSSYQVPQNEISIMLDPGMAFGTGNHETTRMCLEFLIDNKERSQQHFESILDLGCGSGILAIASRLLGFKNVIGLDNDEDAVRISKENAQLNHLTNQISFSCRDLLTLDKPIGIFDCIIANIQADILVNSARKIISHTHNRSNIILSGILTKEIEHVIEVFVRELNKESKFDFKIKELGEWSSVQITKSTN